RVHRGEGAGRRRVGLGRPARHRGLAAGCCVSTAPSATYRLQVRASFDLYAAADACDYLATLGAGAAYLSPLLPSARGSDHGYDVVRFDTVDPQRGGMDGWTPLLAAARSRGLGVVVDIVPNHTGVADATENPAWWDLLKLG